MEKRFFIALLLAAAVVAITQILFPVARPTSSATRRKVDSLSTGKTANQSVASVGQVPSSIVRPPVDSVSVVPSAAPAELTTLETPKSVYRFSNVGAAPVSVALR